MRKLVNNWLFGEVSPLMSGRLDTDVYAAGCARLENMYVHRQGGISRRPPLKLQRKVFANISTGKPTRMIPFTISSGQSFIVFIVPWTDSSHKLSMGVENGQYLSLINATAFQNTTWGTLTEEEVRDIKFATYYNDLYLVHKNCPLLRIRYMGSQVFVAELPEVKVNQSVKRYDIDLSISNFTIGASGFTVQYDITVNGETHNVTRTTTTTVSDLLDSISALQFSGWTLTRTASGVHFEANEEIDKYVGWRLPPANATKSTTVTNCDFKITSVFDYEFSYTFARVEDADETGLVFAQDDFPDMNLNTSGYYASDIAIISERMWLAVNGNPCRLYVSRVYATSQIIYPQTSNDTILDFVQYEVVATTSEKMKEESELPVKIALDTNNRIQYHGSTINQRLWAYSDDPISTKSDYDYAIEQRECAVTMADIPYVEGGVATRRVSTVVAKDSSFQIDYTIMWHLTDDTEVDTTKLEYDIDNDEWSSNIYRYYDEDDSAYKNINVRDTWDAQPPVGLTYSYYPNDDVYIGQTNVPYYEKVGSQYQKVATPVQADMRTYYKRKVVFTSDYAEVVYEKNGQYVLHNTENIVDALFDDTTARIISMSRNGTTYCTAIPYYIFDLSTDSQVYEETTEVDKVATSSTGMDLQFASGRNDYITWIGLGDYILVGTESAEWRIENTLNALGGKATKYSSFGSVDGKPVNVGTDLIFLQKGNKLRLFYKDQWGLQNIELTITNSEIMEGEILNICSVLDPEPALVILKRTTEYVEQTAVYTYSIVYLSVDRTNGVQAFSRWTFDFDVLDICIQEVNGYQHIVALCDEGGKKFTGYFDFNEMSSLKDCGKSGTTVADGIHGYSSLMQANPFDTQMNDGSITLGVAKNVSKIVFRCLDTGKLIYWHNEKDKTISRTPICCDTTGAYVGGLADFSMNVDGGTTRDLMVTVESYEDQPMNLLAMAYEVRVNRNGY